MGAADEYIVQGRLGLGSGSVLRIEDGPGVVVYVWEGELWLTQEGDPRDHFVRAGEWFRIDREGAAVGSALGGGAVVSVTAPRPDFVTRKSHLPGGIHARLAAA